MWKCLNKGFTVTELLIALSILGLIATFTIPKVISSQQNGQYSAAAKESVSAVVAAYQAWALQNGGGSTTAGFSQFVPYLNYTKLDSSSTIDHIYTNSTVSLTCGASSSVCLQLHSGAVIRYFPQDTFGGTASTNGIAFYLDPDGHVTDGTTNGPGKSIIFFLMYNGRVTDNTSGYTISYNNGSPQSWGSCATCKPPWFDW
jgi:prepilin-type N-terminal cleavage/methylation domain-containing protein